MKSKLSTTTSMYYSCVYSTIFNTCELKGELPVLAKARYTNLRISTHTHTY